MKKIRVLVVDDSIFFREMIVKALNTDPAIEVVAVAGDAYEARDRIIEYKPDVMTLDVELPKMSGIEFLKKLIPQYPLPTVVVSSLNMNVFDALKAGAVDFVNKPQVQLPSDVEQFVKRELSLKIKIASTAKIGAAKLASPVPAKNDTSAAGQMVVHAGTVKAKDKIIAIGASTGGTEAIFDVLSGMTADVPGILITQHMPPGFTKMFAERLNQNCPMKVKEAATGDRVVQGLALLAPGDAHMRLVKMDDGYQVECKPGEKVSGHCPSVDVMFESVAKVAGKNAIGVLLTGMGADGAEGLLKMRNSGAITFGQDEASAVVYGMPKVAFDKGAVMHQLPLSKISEGVYKYL